MRKLQQQRAALKDFHKQQFAEAEKRYGRLPNRVVIGSCFDERTFGEPVITSSKDAQVLSRIVVSIALFDGDKMIFACSGIPLPDRKPTQLRLTRFVTSARLAREFNANRYKDDKLRVQVRLPHNQTVDALLGLYDEDIAIVTSLCLLDVQPIDLDYPVAIDLPGKYVCGDNRILAVGCAFESGSLMATKGNGSRFLGMNDKHLSGADVKILSQKFLRERLEHFQILNPKELHFRGYSLPKGVSRIVPSGFWDTVNWIKSRGYPIPPPLVLELNGELLNRFEEVFGDIIAWKGYPFGCPPTGSEYGVWKQLPENVVRDISHSVVSVASFNGDERFFVCTGLLIRWRGNCIVLTSASLIRSRYNEDDIDNNLRIKVFLPPDHVSGTLEAYNLHYNIAVLSVPKNLGAIHPADIFNKVQVSSKNVVSIGRDPEHGLLMASFGELKYRKKDVKHSCKDLQLSTCKIKMAGIGDPLIRACLAWLHFTSEQLHS